MADNFNLALIFVVGGFDQLPGGTVVASNRIEVEQDRRILEQIGDVGNGSDKGKVKLKALPSNCFVRLDTEDEDLQRTAEDGWGFPLRFVFAEDLQTVRLPRNASQWNRALAAFINTIPPKTPIILYWH